MRVSRAISLSIVLFNSATVITALPTDKGRGESATHHVAPRNAGDAAVSEKMMHIDVNAMKKAALAAAAAKPVCPTLDRVTDTPVAYRHAIWNNPSCPENGCKISPCGAKTPCCVKGTNEVEIEAKGFWLTDVTSRPPLLQKDCPTRDQVMMTGDNSADLHAEWNDPGCNGCPISPCGDTVPCCVISTKQVIMNAIEDTEGNGHAGPAPHVHIPATHMHIPHKHHLHIPFGDKRRDH